MRLCPPEGDGRTGQVSIHAPAWGATAGAGAGLQHPAVSIHSPVWGATCPLRLWNMARTCFNPRTRVGCDHGPHVAHGGRPAVSIHAPAWGATHAARPAESGPASFNPRTRVGCDRPNADWEGREYGFQSTHPRGVRRWTATLRAVGGRFQSTHPRGVRRSHRPFVDSAPQVSIHAPAWGATFQLPYIRIQGGEFQSTHPRGVRLAVFMTCSTVAAFQSTHPRGVRREAQTKEARP